MERPNELSFSVRNEGDGAPNSQPAVMTSTPGFVGELQLLAGGELEARLQVHERVGGGSSARVYRGTLDGSIAVAVKVLHPHAAQKEATLQEFLREAQVLARLQHKHIVRLHALAHLPPHFAGLPTRRFTWGIVTELMEAGSLTRLVQEASKVMKQHQALKQQQQQLQAAVSPGGGASTGGAGGGPVRSTSLRQLKNSLSFLRRTLALDNGAARHHAPHSATSEGRGAGGSVPGGAAGPSERAPSATARQASSLALPQLPYSDREALQWCLEVALALQFLHAQNPPIVHRDIKTDNVLMGVLPLPAPPTRGSTETGFNGPSVLMSSHGGGGAGSGSLRRVLSVRAAAAAAAAGEVGLPGRWGSMSGRPGGGRPLTAKVCDFGIHVVLDYTRPALNGSRRRSYELQTGSDFLAGASNYGAAGAPVLPPALPRSHANSYTAATAGAPYGHRSARPSYAGNSVGGPSGPTSAGNLGPPPGGPYGGGMGPSAALMALHNSVMGGGMGVGGYGAYGRLEPRSRRSSLMSNRGGPEDAPMLRKPSNLSACESQHDPSGSNAAAAAAALGPGGSPPGPRAAALQSGAHGPGTWGAAATGAAGPAAAAAAAAAALGAPPHSIGRFSPSSASAGTRSPKSSGAGAGPCVQGPGPPKWSASNQSLLQQGGSMSGMAAARMSLERLLQGRMSVSEVAAAAVAAAASSAASSDRSTPTLLLPPGFSRDGGLGVSSGHPGPAAAASAAAAGALSAVASVAGVGGGGGGAAAVESLSTGQMLMQLQLQYASSAGPSDRMSRLRPSQAGPVSSDLPLPLPAGLPLDPPVPRPGAAVAGADRGQPQPAVAWPAAGRHAGSTGQGAGTAEGEGGGRVSRPGAAPAPSPATSSRGTRLKSNSTAVAQYLAMMEEDLQLDLASRASSKAQADLDQLCGSRAGSGSTAPASGAAGRSTQRSLTGAGAPGASGGPSSRGLLPAGTSQAYIPVALLLQSGATSASRLSPGGGPTRTSPPHPHGHGHGRLNPHHQHSSNRSLQGRMAVAAGGAPRTSGSGDFAGRHSGNGSPAAPAADALASLAGGASDHRAGSPHRGSPSQAQATAVPGQLPPGVLSSSPRPMNRTGGPGPASAGGVSDVGAAASVGRPLPGIPPTSPAAGPSDASNGPGAGAPSGVAFGGGGAPVPHPARAPRPARFSSQPAMCVGMGMASVSAPYGTRGPPPGKASSQPAMSLFAALGSIAGAAPRGYPALQAPLLPGRSDSSPALGSGLGSGAVLQRRPSASAGRLAAVVTAAHAAAGGGGASAGGGAEGPSRFGPGGLVRTVSQGATAMQGLSLSQGVGGGGGGINCPAGFIIGRAASHSSGSRPASHASSHEVSGMAVAAATAAVAAAVAPGGQLGPLGSVGRGRASCKDGGASGTSPFVTTTGGAEGGGGGGPPPDVQPLVMDVSLREAGGEALRGESPRRPAVAAPVPPWPEGGHTAATAAAPFASSPGIADGSGARSAMPGLDGDCAAAGAGAPHGSGDGAQGGGGPGGGAAGHVSASQLHPNSQHPQQHLPGGPKQRDFHMVELHKVVRRLRPSGGSFTGGAPALAGPGGPGSPLGLPPLPAGGGCAEGEAPSGAAASVSRRSSADSPAHSAGSGGSPAPRRAVPGIGASVSARSERLGSGPQFVRPPLSAGASSNLGGGMAAAAGTTPGSDPNSPVGGGHGYGARGVGLGLARGSGGIAVGGAGGHGHGHSHSTPGVAPGGARRGSSGRGGMGVAALVAGSPSSGGGGGGAASGSAPHGSVSGKSSMDGRTGRQGSHPSFLRNSSSISNATAAEAAAAALAAAGVVAGTGLGGAVGSSAPSSTALVPPAGAMGPHGRTSLQRANTGSMRAALALAGASHAPGPTSAAGSMAGAGAGSGYGGGYGSGYGSGYGPGRPLPSPLPAHVLGLGPGHGHGQGGNSATGGSMTRLASGSGMSGSLQGLGWSGRDELGPQGEALYALTGRAGTLMYMAPEVLRDEPYNEKADVFSFGVVLYEMFARLLLLESYGREELEVLSSRVAQGFRHHRPDCMPQAVWDIIQQCWAQSPSQRPPMPLVVRQLELVAEALDEQAQAAAVAACGPAGRTGSLCALDPVVLGGMAGGLGGGPASPQGAAPTRQSSVTGQGQRSSGRSLASHRSLMSVGSLGRRSRGMLASFRRRPAAPRPPQPTAPVPGRPPPQPANRHSGEPAAGPGAGMGTGGGTPLGTATTAALTTFGLASTMTATMGGSMPNSPLSPRSAGAAGQEQGGEGAPAPRCAPCGCVIC